MVQHFQNETGKTKISNKLTERLVSSGIKVTKTQFHPVVLQNVSIKPLKCCSSIASTLSKYISVICKSIYFAKP